MPAIPSEPRSADRAEVGIGTLIVFIAAVLVAAVAAAVLINTSSELQQTGEASGGQALKDVGTQVILRGAWGSRPGTTGNMEHLNLTIGLSSSSAPLDLSTMTVLLTTGTSVKTILYAAGAPGANQFNVTAVRDGDGSLTAPSAIMTANDLATLWFDMSASATDVDLAPGKPLHFQFVPLSGSPFMVDLVMPANSSSDTIVTIR